MSIRLKPSSALAACLVTVFLLVPGRTTPASEGVNEGDTTAIERDLKRFNDDPAAMMDEDLPRWDAQGGAVPHRPRFSPQSIASGAAIAARDARRARMCMTDRSGKVLCLGQGGAPIGTRSVIEGNDQPEDLVDSGAIRSRTLEAMEGAGLKSAWLGTEPWSDDYWPTYRGILGARYADDDSKHKRFADNYAYVRAHPASRIVASGNADAIDRLSPSEKYELLIGDSANTLTSRQWAEGQGYADSSGNVEDWMGICHGWSNAAIMLPRPSHAVTLRSFDGSRDVRFYPSDIKALGSLLWANGTSSWRFVGGRCNDAHPAKDSHGRVIAQDCFDTNPGAWHLAVTQQIGVERRGFVIDATFDYEVWNQPVQGYKYRYFNPQTGKLAEKLSDAAIPRASYTRDPFAAYRSPYAASVVGIVMDLIYVAETDPSHATTDSPDDDYLVTVRYTYDLELDSAGKVIGGEWHTNKHPDFMWVARPGAHARSIAEDEATGAWDGTGSIPASWRQAALDAETRSQPLGKLVETLFGLVQ
jgi:hypothetical protein